MVSIGDSVIVAASGKSNAVKRIVTFDGDLPSAGGGDAVTLVLADELDVTRGDILAGLRNRPDVADQIATHVVWMGHDPMLAGRSYLSMCGTRIVPVRITTLKYVIDVADLS